MLKPGVGRRLLNHGLDIAVPEMGLSGRTTVGQERSCLAKKNPNLRLAVLGFWIVDVCVPWQSRSKNTSNLLWIRKPPLKLDGINRQIR